MGIAAPTDRLNNGRRLGKRERHWRWVFEHAQKLASELKAKSDQALGTPPQFKPPSGCGRNPSLSYTER